MIVSYILLSLSLIKADECGYDATLVDKLECSSQANFYIRVGSNIFGYVQELTLGGGP